MAIEAVDILYNNKKKNIYIYVKSIDKISHIQYIFIKSKDNFFYYIKLLLNIHEIIFNFIYYLL
jgi:hypothetical protein